MKKAINTLTLAAALIFVCQLSFAQFEGIIKFKKDKQGEITNFVYYVKGKDVRVDEFGSDGSVKGIMLVDIGTLKVTALSPDRKLYMDASNNKPNPEVKPEVSKTTNKKKIANYDCTEWIVKSTAEGTEISYWVGGDNFDFFEPLLKALNRKDRLSKYFLEVPGNDKVFTMMGVEKGLDGSIRTTLEVSSVEQKSLGKDVFQIPDGYVKFEK
jgi:hypothetical protein